MHSAAYNSSQFRVECPDQHNIPGYKETTTETTPQMFIPTTLSNLHGNGEDPVLGADKNFTIPESVSRNTSSRGMFYTLLCLLYCVSLHESRMIVGMVL